MIQNYQRVPVSLINYYLGKDMQPLYTVEIPGFKRLVSKLDPKCALPSRNYISETEIPGLYNQVRDNAVKPQLREAVHFSSTTNLWTSYGNHPYLSLTVLYKQRLRPSVIKS